MSDPNELKRTLMFARDLADPDWSLSVPVPAKETIRKLLAIIEAAKPRTITTAEELDTLPEGTILLDAEGGTSIRARGGWRTTIIESTGEAWITVPLEDAELPATILHEPTVQ